MKLVLLKDDKRYGKKGDIINVNDGFANNYLIPNKVGVPATSTALNEAKQLKDSEAHKEQVAFDEAKTIADKLKNIEIIFKVKVGENGKLFGSITNKEIAQELLTYNIDVDKKKIEIFSPIKTVGLYTVKLKLHTKVTGQLKINVVPL